MTQGNIPRSDYSFPNVSFTESVVGPLPFTPQWRNTIGVAGVFSRGPAGPTRITNRQDFAYLFGEDDSAGALFVRQAMLQGATNFVVSRVMPNPSASSGAIYLQSGINPSVTEAFVGPGDARTVGMTFEASYIGSPLISLETYIGADIQVASDQSLKIPNFSGTGYLDFRIVEKVTSNSPASGPIAAQVANISGTSSIQVVQVTGTDAAAFAAAAKPGKVLRTAGPAVFNSGSGAYLTLLSYAYQESTGTWSALAQGSVSGVVAGTTSVTVESAAQSSPDYFVLAYLYRAANGASLPTTTLASRNYGGYTADGFLVVPVTYKSYQNVYLTQNNAGTLSLLDTGIDLAIGNSSDTAATELVPSAKFTIPFMRAEVRVGETDPAATTFPNTPSAFATGLAGVEILNQLRRMIAVDDTLSALLDNVQVNDGQLPYSLTFTSTFEGEESNRIIYKLTRTVGGGSPNDLLFQSTGNLYGVNIPMSGGRDPMTDASLYLYDVMGNPLVYIEAVSPGSFGNDISITVNPSSAGSFRLEVTDQVGINYNVPIRPESFTLSNFSVDPSTGLYSETLDSKLIRAYFVPVMNSNGQAISKSVYNQTPQRVAPPVQTLDGTNAISSPLHPSHKGVAYLSNLPLTGGSEPADYRITDPSEDDYLQAVRRLEETDCAIISLAGVSAADARYEMAVTELVVQAERSSTLNGLRIAVIAGPARLTEGRAPSIASGTSSNRVVIVNGYSTLVGARYLGVNAISPAGLYAGNLACISPQVSPASVSSGQAVTGVLSVDTKNTPSYLDTLTRARLEALYFDQGLQLYKFLNGLTTSNDPYEKYVSVRRVSDQIIMDLYRNLQWVRSSPNTRSLRSRVATACDAYLKALQRDEMIYGYSPTLCDESNNSIQDMSSGRLNIRLTFTPVYPADFIRVNVIRDLTTEFSITAGAGS